MVWQILGLGDNLLSLAVVFFFKYVILQKGFGQNAVVNEEIRNQTAMRSQQGIFQLYEISFFFIKCLPYKTYKKGKCVGLLTQQTL